MPAKAGSLGASSATGRDRDGDKSGQEDDGYLPHTCFSQDGPEPDEDPGAAFMRRLDGRVVIGIVSVSR